MEKILNLFFSLLLYQPYHRSPYFKKDCKYNDWEFKQFINDRNTWLEESLRRLSVIEQSAEIQRLLYQLRELNDKAISDIDKAITEVKVIIQNQKTTSENMVVYDQETQPIAPKYDPPTYGVTLY